MEVGSTVGSSDGCCIDKEIDCIETIDENEWIVGSRDTEVDCMEIIVENEE